MSCTEKKRSGSFKSVDQHTSLTPHTAAMPSKLSKAKEKARMQVVP